MLHYCSHPEDPIINSGVTGGGRVPPETSDREISEKRGKEKRKKEQNGKEKKENFKRKGGKLEMEGRKVTK